MTESNPSRRARRAIAALASLSVSLVCAVVFLGYRLSKGGSQPFMLRDDAVQQAAIAELVAGASNVFDSHPDADVSRVLLPGLDEVEFKGIKVSSNRFGMREREYALPKPVDLVRVVLLGDSFVLGVGARAEERFGVVLERELRARSRWPAPKRIEVLHIGVGSWNTRAESTFLRRQLSDFDPDLVVQVFIGNDFDDNSGVRGFGGRAHFDPRHPERASARTQLNYPILELGSNEGSALLLGLDGESRARYEEVFSHIGRIAGEVDRRGASYLLLLTSTRTEEVGKVLLTNARRFLRENQIVVLDRKFMVNRQHCISVEDRHWNPLGHERVATMLYGVIEGRGLLPELELSNWPSADENVARMHDAGLARIESATEAPPFPVGPALTEDRQIYGGIDSEGRVGPYASFIVEPGGRSRLVLRGSFFERQELDRGTVRVFVDEEELGALSMVPGESFERSFEVPADVARRSHVAVRLVSDDWVLQGPNARDCISFLLDSAEFALD